MTTAIVIPSRFNSQRFPGKPLINILGKSLIQRVWTIAQSAQNVEAVYIATDDQRIAQHARQFNASVVMTDDCHNGTERVLKALQQSSQSYDLIVNLQGDSVLLPTVALQQLIDTMQADEHIQIGTLAMQITHCEYENLQKRKQHNPFGGTMVTINPFTHDALYFSKNMIPCIRHTTINPMPLYQHIGLYAFRYPALIQYVHLPPTPLEQVEGLEQLRALEHGMKIRVVLANITAQQCASIDHPHDIQYVEQQLSTQNDV